MGAVIEPLVRLRVLVEFDHTIAVFVARCLETGHVLTADSAAAAREMIVELLADELNHAIEHLNFVDLLSKPASTDVFARWLDLTRKHPPKAKILYLNAEMLRLDEEREAAVEIRIAATNEAPAQSRVPTKHK
ncbi:MAG: hypothetical protein NVS9B12_14050 [Vulcanimicrobiaceae bacterium]